MIVLEIFAEQQVEVFWKSFNRIDYVSSSCLEKLMLITGLCHLHYATEYQLYIRNDVI